MHKVPDTAFRGFIWEPTTEQEVVMLFGVMLQRGDFGPLCVDHAQTPFPDCTAINTATSERIHIEFEYFSKDFMGHHEEWEQLKEAHPDDHWWLVSWRDDLSDSDRRKITGVKVVTLRDRAKILELVLNWFDGKPDDIENLFKWRAQSLPAPYPAIIQQLQEFGESASEPAFKIEWPEKREAQFVVWDVKRNIRCFGVLATGTLNVPFAKWHSGADHLVGEVSKRLDLAVGRKLFVDPRRKKGFDLTYVLRNDDGVKRFLDVWRWFAHQA